MVKWSRLFNLDGSDRRHLHDEFQSLLPTHRNDTIPSAIPAKEVTKVALRLKHQIEQVIPCELPEESVTKAHSSVITPAVVATAKSAGKIHAPGSSEAPRRITAPALELWDADLHDVRAVACEVLAKKIIEDEDDTGYLLEEVLLKRYSVLVNNEETIPANAIERAVDLHALRVIGSSGYQKCIAHLWRGWLVQDDDDPSRFVDYKRKASTEYWDHFDPDRMRVPAYQTFVQVALSIIYLGLYTGAINTINPSGDLDLVEGLLYIFTVGYIFDEIAKFWKVGRYYLAFWNLFNSTLYGLLTVSFVTRMIALGHHMDDPKRGQFNELSYNFLAFTAPMFWMRLLLYLDTFRFFGAMLVVLKVMMKESLIFFALLIVVLIGFLQAFVGMDQADNNLDATSFIVQAMANAVMGSPEFDGFDNFAPPFGLILYYIYNFIVIVVLLNILIALYNSAYEDITDNSIDEYMALFASKTMQFVRAPDENVFIPPFNLVELFFLVLPFEWWMSKESYERLNDYVMGALYSPVLLITAALETRTAYKVKWNRKRGEEDEDTTEEWEQMEDEVDFEGEGWSKRVENTRPNVETDATLSEVKELRKEIDELKSLLRGISSREGTRNPS
ncbi:Calcium channel yvc1 [Taxawa tesnikishii (nom. ined.)]|nr:Calcium channel yvc1 [Dothideales sp. JES 119]